MAVVSPASLADAMADAAPSVQKSRNTQFVTGSQVNEQHNVHYMYTVLVDICYLSCLPK